MTRYTLKTAFGLVLFSLFSTAAGAAQYTWSGVDRVVALSDPHGAYDAIVSTLQNTDVIDAESNWSGGETHLVITGDLLDRGADSRKIMDLVMQLESQAPESGGMVHLTLGNHEVMNLVGDLRYVARGEFAAFVDDGPTAERERWYQIIRSVRQVQTDAEVDDAALREEFDKTRPPGLYRHRQAFGPTGKYGQWLLQKPLMVVINDTAYVHGGLPPWVAELGLEKLNDELGAQLRSYVEAVAVLDREGLLDPAINFYEHGRIAEGIATDATIPAGILAALDTVAKLSDARIHEMDSPLWYRGTVGCSTLAEGDIVDAVLDALNAKRAVIGHTPTVTRRVLERHDGRVIEIDTGMLTSAYRGSGHALIIEGDDLAVISEDNREPGRPVPHPRRVGARDDHLSAELLEKLLSEGQVLSVSTGEDGRTVAEINRDGTTVSALFVESPRRKGLSPQIAAYRLDIALGLEMVPVTVEREVEGKRGTLQFLPKNARTEGYRAGSGQGGSAWCPLGRQWNSMYIFDTLIYNEGRSQTSMAYSPGNWQLLLTGNANSFSTKRARPPYLKEVPFELSQSWVDALGALSDQALTEHLGDVLDKRRISALGKRRDMLLSEPQ